MPTHAGRGGTTVLARFVAHVNEKDLFMFLKVSINTALNVNGREFADAFRGTILLFMTHVIFSKDAITKDVLCINICMPQKRKGTQMHLNKANRVTF